MWSVPTSRATTTVSAVSAFDPEILVVKSFFVLYNKDGDKINVLIMRKESGVFPKSQIKRRHAYDL